MRLRPRRSQDVFSVEPPLPSNPLLKCDGFYGTPHVGGATLEAQARAGVEPSCKPHPSGATAREKHAASHRGVLAVA